ncbi:MAG: hypothetical protein M3R38_01100 [Actinomycetota bacterium]|nr:hypothetical protein [Actinomycetota bacterium]
MTEINREDFAVQMDYVALLGKLIAPQVLSLLDDTVLFTGETPYLSSDLMRLLPAQVKHYEDLEVPEFVPEGVRFTIVIVGRDAFSEESIDHVLATSGDSPPHLSAPGGVPRPAVVRSRLVARLPGSARRGARSPPRSSVRKIVDDLPVAQH